MKIYDKNQIAYQDIKIEDNTIFLKSDTFEKKLTSLKIEKRTFINFRSKKKCLVQK